jgi:hypothetical protein
MIMTIMNQEGLSTLTLHQMFCLFSSCCVHYIALNVKSILFHLLCLSFDDSFQVKQESIIVRNVFLAV